MEIDKKEKLFFKTEYRTVRTIISNWNVHNDDSQMIDRDKDHE